MFCVERFYLRNFSADKDRRNDFVLLVLTEILYMQFFFN